MKAKIKGFETEINESDIEVTPFEIEFGGELKILVDKSESGYVVINAVNGYGQNCYPEFINEKLTLAK
jgi:hypothetical protein